MRDIRAMLPEEIQGQLLEMGEKSYRAGQIFKWLHRGVTHFNEMTYLSKTLQNTLAARFALAVPQLVRREAAKDGTVKYLWRLEDGHCIETVFMRYRHGNTICISTQVGCRMGCSFCASTIGGLERNLEPFEMLDQVLFTAKECGEEISNIVLMGIGEPLDNFDNVMRFLQLVNHPQGLHIGMRHITLSTCGLVEMIDKLGEHNLQLTLSVSLHAPDDATRNRLVPVNRKAGVEALLAVCHRYFARTGRRVSFEYAMIAGVNDAPWQARLLARQMREVGGHVNLIPLNPIVERTLSPSQGAHIESFVDILRKQGVNCTIRRNLGQDIKAACGQLRRQEGCV